MTNKAKRVRKVIEKLGWISFAGYAATRLCGADKIASVASILTVSCVVIVNGMKVTEEIQGIVTS